MAYITYSELTTRYATVANWSGSETQVNSGLIHYAEVELNSRLASHFSVPFATAYPVIKDITMDIAYYKSLVMRDPEKAKLVKEALNDRIEALKNGDELIYTDSGTLIEASPTTGSELWSNYEDYHPVHSMLDAEDPLTRVDSNYIDALENERE